MRQTPATAALGCGGSLILMGSFISGFYLGQSQAIGRSVDPLLADVLKWGPSSLGGLYSLVAATVNLNVPGNIEEMIEKTPMGVDPVRAEGCMRGCGPWMGGVAGAVMMGATTYLGYAVGHAMGK